MTLNQSLSSVDAGRIHGRREEILLEHAGLGEDIMNNIRIGFQQVEIQSGVNAIMATGGIRVNDSSINITNPAGPGNNFFNGGDSNNFWDFSTGGGGGGEQGAPGSQGLPGNDGNDGNDGAPGSGAFWEDGKGTILQGDGSSIGNEFSVDFDHNIDEDFKSVVTFDEDTFPTEVLPGSLSLLAGHDGSPSYEIVAGELLLKLHMVRLYLDRNDGSGVVEGHLDYVSEHTIAIPLEEQACPDPCGEESLQIFADGHGNANYEDVGTKTIPIVIPANVWTTITNDAQGAQTLETYLPSGVTTLFNPSTNKVDLSELAVGSGVFIRYDFDITTSVNGSYLQIRFTFGSGLGSFPLPQPIGPLANGAKYVYKISYVKYVYIGSEDVRDNGVGFEVNCSEDSLVVNNGMAIQVVPV